MEHEAPQRSNVAMANTSYLVPVAAVFVLAVSTARAESGNPLTDRFSINLGSFFLNTSTTVRVDGTNRRGTELKMEDELGLDDTDRFRIDAYWRFRPRHKLRVMYFDTRQSDSVQIARDITFRDVTYPIAAELTTEFETTVAELAYEYAFLRRERYELAGTIGVHNLEFDLRLSAMGASQTETLSRSASANGPLPVVGLRGLWRITDWLYADAQAQFFKISLDPYDGRLEDYTAALVWRPVEHVALGVGYNEFVTRVDVSGSQFDGRLRWHYGGALVFINLAF